MFRNYIKTACRSLIANSSYSIINISGLAIGIAVCMMIFLMIQFHTSFDNFHEQKDRIYRVLREHHNQKSATTSYGADLPIPFPTALKTAFPM